MDRTPPIRCVTDRRTLDDATIAAHAEKVRTDGWAVVENAIDLDLVDAISDDLLRLERDLGIVPADNLFEGRRTTRIYNLLVHGPSLRADPGPPQRPARSSRGSSIPGLLISSLSSIAIGSDEQAQPIHSDDQLIPLPKPHPPLICNTMWAITDFTEENGATRLCPGTHTRRPLPRPARALRLDRGRDAQRQRPRLGREPVARRRGQHHRAASGGDRHELLRRLRPPAGEPAARHPARDRCGGSPGASRSCAAIRSTTGSSATSTSSTPGSCSSAQTRTPPSCGTTPRLRRPERLDRNRSPLEGQAGPVTCAACRPCPNRFDDRLRGPPALLRLRRTARPALVAFLRRRLGGLLGGLLGSGLLGRRPFSRRPSWPWARPSWRCPSPCRRPPANPWTG